MSGGGEGRADRINFKEVALKKKKMFSDYFLPGLAC